MNSKPDWRKAERGLQALQQVRNAIMLAMEVGLSPVEIREWVEVSIVDAEFDIAMDIPDEPPNINER